VASKESDPVNVYMMFHNHMSLIQEVIPKFLLSEKCFINVGTIWNGYRGMGRES
jgi:hypothetical protein